MYFDYETFIFSFTDNRIQNYHYNLNHSSNSPPSTHPVKNSLSNLLKNYY